MSSEQRQATDAKVGPPAVGAGPASGGGSGPTVERESGLGLVRVLAVCLAVVGAFFLAFEVVERTWLKGVGADVLHDLYIARGLAASAIAAVLAIFLLLRRLGTVPPLEGRSPEVGGWKRRLQHVSLHTKVSVPMVVLAVAPAAAVSLFTISRTREALRDQVVRRIEFDTRSRADAVGAFVQALHRDLRFVSRMQVIRDLAAAEATAGSRRLAALRRAAERELAVFSPGRRGYSGLRYLDGDGREVMRLEAAKGAERLVPVAPREGRSDPHYLGVASSLQPGEVYIVSRVDPAADGAGAARPMAFSCGTPVVPHRVGRRGLLVIDIDAEYLFSLLTRGLPTGTEAWLVDDRGSYLGYAGPSEEKRRIYDMGAGRPISADFGPAELPLILDAERRGGTLETGESFFSFAPVAFDARSPDRRWTLLVARPIAPAYGPVREATVLVLLVLGLVTAVSGIIGLLVGHYVVRPVQTLRRATVEIAGGDLSRRVQVATGDEIEGLAADFNAMTEQLSAAHERLASWNEELRREVARRTDHLRRLQAGLARADKLASIGQLAESVMHEIGNPLAAIKTKIQVAEQEGDVRTEDRPLFGEVVREVDRLASVLRSFSRLGRLREPSFGTVKLEEVVRDVNSLVAPELRRKGVALRVVCAADLPDVRGDPDQLHQAIINLVLNAAEASSEGGEVSLRLNSEVRAQEAGRRALIEVADRGTGIPPEHLDRMWDPFFTTKPDGTGLGLAICRQIVEDHRGTVEIRSQPGQGTVVTVAFPEATGDAPVSPPRDLRAAPGDRGP